MKLPLELVRLLIPEGTPALDNNYPEVNEIATTIQNDQEKRSWLWAHAILRTIDFQRVFHGDGVLPLRTSHVSAGFVYINKKAKVPPALLNRPGAFAFGGYVLVNSNSAQEQEVKTISIGKRVFPLVINYGKMQPHGCPPHPPGGTGCCWAKDASGKASWSKGLITSRHVVSSFSLGAHIPLSPSVHHTFPSYGNLADIDACTIDAAVIEIDPLAWPTGLHSLTAKTTIAPGSTSHFNGPFTTTTGLVLRVFQDNIYYGNLFGQRVIADCHGIPGESGTLLLDGSGDGLGVYMGTIPDGNGSHDGIFQDLKQIEHYFKLDLYY